MQRRLILGSSSKPRQMLLQQLSIPFEVTSPNVDESRIDNESPTEMVLRLAELKARIVAKKFPNDIIIGADQIGVLENDILGKPLTLEVAQEYLKKISGKSLVFYIGLCLLDAKHNHLQASLETFTVKFRPLTTEMISHYLEKEQPLYCAGSFKAEGLGITLVEEFQGKDFTGLIGLPLIKLTDMLRNVGLNPI